MSGDFWASSSGFLGVRITWRRREDGEGGQGRKEETLVEGHWPGNQEVWVDIPALPGIVIAIIGRIKFS